MFSVFALILGILLIAGIGQYYYLKTLIDIKDRCIKRQKGDISHLNAANIKLNRLRNSLQKCYITTRCPVCKKFIKQNTESLEKGMKPIHEECKG